MKGRRFCILTPRISSKRNRPSEESFTAPEFFEIALVW